MKQIHIVAVFLIIAILAGTLVSAESASTLITASKDVAINLTAGQTKFENKIAGVSFTSSTKVDDKDFAPTTAKTVGSELVWSDTTANPGIEFKYSQNGNTLKETITLDKDIKLSFPVTPDKNSKLIPWDNGRWKIVSATSGDTMNGIVAEKPFGIDAKGNRIEMVYTYENGMLNLVYDRKITGYSQTETELPNGTINHISTKFYSDITYPLVIDPTWVSASGCWTDTNGTETIVMWNATGLTTWIVPAGVTELKYLIIAGGGGGGYDSGGGGGAGGVLGSYDITGGGGALNPNLTVSPGSSIVVTVGAGGTAGWVGGNGGYGGNSSLANTTVGNGVNAKGGAGGQTASSAVIPAGGSGGGGSGGSSQVAGSAGTTGQGYAGGTAVSAGAYYPGGGGGGAGAVGGSPATGSSPAGNGGIGVYSQIDGTGAYYAGGGGAGGTDGGGGAGGNGGGGATSTAGVDGTGGGGGGSGGTPAKGGSGVVIIRYEVYVAPPGAPEASFTSNVTSGLTPPDVGVQFNDTTVLNPTTWNWSYTNYTPGNNTRIIWSTEQNATYAFGNGDWKIYLNVTNASGEDDTLADPIYWVNVSSGVPIAKFHAASTTYHVGDTILFLDDSIASNASVIDDWYWEFGEAAPPADTSTDENPAKVYSAVGTYTVNERVNNGTYGSDWENKTDYISIIPYVGVVEHVLLMTPAYNLTVTFKDTHGVIIPNVTVTDSLAYTETIGNGVFVRSYDYSTVGIYAYSVGYSSGSGSYIMDSDRNETIVLTEASPAPSQNIWNTPKTIRFMCRDWQGEPIKEMNVSAVGIQSTLGAVDWVLNLFGIDLSKTPVLNTTMNGTTGNDGSIVFVMVPTEKYSLTYVCSTKSIYETRYYYIKQEEYEETFWTAAPVYSSDVITYSLYNKTNGSYMDIGVSYSDPATTTRNLTFFIKNKAGTIIYSNSTTVPIGAWNVSYPVDTTKDNVYTFGMSANTSAYQEPINATRIFRVEGNVMFLIDMHIGYDAAALEIYNWIAVVLISIIAFIFSRVSMKFGVAVVPIMALFFKFINWLQTPWLLLGLGLTLGMFWYLRYAEQGE